jgi:hypothetical protein
MADSLGMLGLHDKVLAGKKKWKEYFEVAIIATNKFPTVTFCSSLLVVILLKLFTAEWGAVHS